MRRLLDGLQGFFGLFLLAAMLVGWSGVSESGGFIGPNSTVTVEISADKTTLPINILNIGPSIGGPYTNTVNVTVKQNGKLLAAPINVAVAAGLSSGALYYLDGDPEHEQCPTGATCPPTATVPIAFRQLAFEDATGIVTFHFNASSAPGTVVLTASAQDPNSGKVISGSLTIEVVGGSSVTGGMPAAVKFVMDTAPVYIRDNPLGTTTATQNTTKLFQIFVQDDFGQTISQGTGNALQVQMLLYRPYGGEWLSGTSADGNTQQGATLKVGLFGGAATMVLHGGTVPGTVVISATADRADNNVDNGIQMGITNYAMVSIGTGEIKTLTFTGPLADAVFVGANNLIAVADGSLCGANACDTIWNGIYSRVISVIASDPYGNPPPEGTPITFRLIDSPLDLLQNRYPEQGHGQFAITGYTGDPQEGGLEFLAPNRKTKRTAADTLNPFVVPNGVSYAIANPLCLLMLQDPETSENRPEYHVGSRIIIGRAGNMLTVNTAFNQVSQNVGANVLYTVGCPPYKGNVANFDSNEVVVMTNANGAAHTVMNYPASQVGRRFMVAAESNGGKVGAAMTHWYLGTPDGSILTITAPAQLAAQIEPLLTDTPWPALVKVTQTVNPGEALTLPVTLQVLDGGVLSGGALKRTPIPGVSIAVDIVINDPAEAAAIVAEEAQAKAQASYDAFVAANPGVCDLVLKDAEGEPVERDPEKCATQKALATALDEAKIAAIEARTVANLHTPTASVEPATVASGTSGYARLVLNVNDLPTDGSVDFSFSTVGPEIRSEVLQITVQPPQTEE
jgi:hypothetical protein